MTEQMVQRRVREATYLAAEKAWSYRVILRFCFTQHERMKQFLYIEDIEAYLKTLPSFSHYDLDDVQQDVQQLVQWGNLKAQQETGRVNTVDEFKKKRFRYQCTPFTVEFERTLVRMEQQGDEFGGSLERSQFQRLYEKLQLVQDSLTSTITDEECAQRWDDVMMYFRAITENTSDYFAHIDGEQANERMQQEAFLVYKDRFTSYLRDFIRSLQRMGLHIQSLLNELTPRETTAFFEQVARHKAKVVHFEETDETAVLQEYAERWRNLADWFIGSETRQSEFSLIQERTAETIRRVTRTAQQLGERDQHFRSRKKDYLHLAEWFEGLTSMEEAHRLSAAVFGVFHTKHLQAEPKVTENIYMDVWETEASVHETTPRIRNYGEKTKAGAVEEHKAEKEAQREAFLAQRKQERLIVERYINGNEIRFRDLHTIEPPVRKLFLSWLSRAMMKETRQIKTEFGHDVVVHIDLSAPPVLLTAEDGELQLPDVVFKFKEGAGS
ncbi:TIGR02677 family protein [Aureibacillus halotolerans]|uniref:Uncharacterized protein (TIGR02677 family) n=1 Tax=Aureibacillus halotolerans TaxID=1508390 RepID=A0A4R6TQ58_9BACI|nr:TIGR02677 family protein [Aureibacillus halotolerans]TDQ34639.1 uncharacterized protein (TIGR02677 family) [Aureibacillus halotolerans]